MEYRLLFLRCPYCHQKNRIKKSKVQENHPKCGKCGKFFPLPNEKLESSRKISFRNRIKSTLWRICWKFFYKVIIPISIIVIIITTYLYQNLPDIQQLNVVSNNLQFWLEKEGDKMSRKDVIFNLQIDFNDMPEDLCNGLISMEDRWFYWHYGFNPVAIFKAALLHIQGKGKGGGSTITQQLAKQLFFSGDRLLIRKIKEVLLSIKLEKYYSKSKILEMYLNRVPLGNGMYGIETAARYYFHKRAKDLTIYESALLVGSITLPSRYNYKRNPKKARERADIVISTMLKRGYITDNKAKNKTISMGKRILISCNYSSLFDSIRSEISKSSDIQKRIKNIDGTLIVVSTFDPELQVYAEYAVKGKDKKDRKKNRSIYAKKKVSEIALISLNTDGAVKALVGSLDWKISQVNHTMRNRQYGSIFKPFVYLTALQQGWKPNSLISRGHISIDGWSPKNTGNSYHGKVTLTNGLAYSYNTVAVRLQEKVGRKNVIANAKKLGLTGRLPNQPSLALGTGEGSLSNITQAYAVFANGGNKVPSPYQVVGIRDKMGKILYWHQPQRQFKLIKNQYVTDINNMLRQVVLRGTGKNADVPSYIATVAGKTGTTQNNRDAWFIGYSSYIVTGVWAGNRDNTPMMKSVSGGTLPAKIWKKFMLNAHSGLDLKKKALPFDVN